MNPLAVAIQRAVAVSSNRPSVLEAFQREIEAIEFSSHSAPVILSVPRPAALAWSNGELFDFDLAARAITKPDVVWCFLLPNKQTTRQTFLACRQLVLQGASGFVAHSRSDLMKAHLLRHGCAPRFTAVDGGVRFWGDSTFCRRYFRLTHLPE